MEKERLVLGDVLTPQEHNWRGSTPEFSPTTEQEWYIPDGVLRRKITIAEAIAERKARGFVTGGVISSKLGFYHEEIAIKLEEIDEETGITKDDPKISGVLHLDSIEPESVIDEATGKFRDLTQELINLYKAESLESQLHLRPQSTEEGQNLSFGEGNMGARI